LKTVKYSVQGVRNMMAKVLTFLARSQLAREHFPLGNTQIEAGLCLALVPDRLRLPSTSIEALLPGARATPITIDVLPEGDWQTPLQDLVLLLKAVRVSNARRVLELGSYRGWTAAYIAKHLPNDGVVVAVDAIEEHGTAYRGRELEARIERRTGNITAELFEQDPPGSYDLIFVDSDHRYQGLLAHSELALTLVSPTGYVIWHDYWNFGYFNGQIHVPEVLHELARDKPIVHIAHSGLAITSPAWKGDDIHERIKNRTSEGNRLDAMWRTIEHEMMTGQRSYLPPSDD
jgi:hypothetical protein